MDVTLAQEDLTEELDNDPYIPDGALSQAYRMCLGMELPLPPLPAPLLPLLEQVAETVFTTRTGMTSLEPMGRYVTEAVGGTLIPFVALSHEGHGVNNWYFRYFVVLPQVALFVELPIGGAYTDADAARLEITQALESASRLLSAALATNGEIRYIIEHRGWRGSRWCFSAPDPQWQDVINAIEAVSARMKPDSTSGS